VTSEELRAFCDKVGITPARFAELCGAKPGARPSWTRDGDMGRVPLAVDALALFMEQVHGRASYDTLADTLERQAVRLRAAARAA